MRIVILLTIAGCWSPGGGDERAATRLDDIDRRQGLLGQCHGRSRGGSGLVRRLTHGDGTVAALAPGSELVLEAVDEDGGLASARATLTVAAVDGVTAATGWNIFFSSGRFTD